MNLHKKRSSKPSSEPSVSSSSVFVLRVHVPHVTTDTENTLHQWTNTLRPSFNTVRKNSKSTVTLVKKPVKQKKKTPMLKQRMENKQMKQKMVDVVVNSPRISFPVSLRMTVTPVPIFAKRSRTWKRTTTLT